MHQTTPQLRLDIDNESIPVTSFKEACELVAEFLVTGNAEFHCGQEVMVLGWAMHSESPVVLDRRKVDMFNRL